MKDRTYVINAATDTMSRITTLIHTLSNERDRIKESPENCDINVGMVMSRLSEVLEANGTLRSRQAIFHT